MSDTDLSIAQTFSIDCDAPASVPYKTWSIREQDQLSGRARGIFVWDLVQVSLYATSKQKGGIANGHELLRSLKDKKVFGVQVLDFLLIHQELIPDTWKGQEIYFWGTIYYNSCGVGTLDVRCLRWAKDHWESGFNWIDSVWGKEEPALLLVA
jgi:hypothetical protein